MSAVQAGTSVADQIYRLDEAEATHAREGVQAEKASQKAKVLAKDFLGADDKSEGRQADRLAAEERSTANLDFQLARQEKAKAADDRGMSVGDWQSVVSRVGGVILAVVIIAGLLQSWKAGRTAGKGADLKEKLLNTEEDQKDSCDQVAERTISVSTIEAIPSEFYSNEPDSNDNPLDKSFDGDSTFWGKVWRTVNSSATNVSFIVACQTQFGEEVRIVGNTEKLGQWNPNDALTMKHMHTTEGDKWVATVDLDLPTAASDKHVEYKYVIMSEGQLKTWEHAENRVLTQPRSCSSIVCQDVWGYN